MEQTAVEWLVSKLPQRMLNYLKEEIEQAKEMEKEQQEKMYSEEDMRKAFKSSSLTNILDVYESFEEFIEQFKNK
jgi:predicted ATP-binding protein involved in virulence